MNEIDKLRKDIIDSETFCFYPFLEISTRPNGTVLPCCYYNELEHLTHAEKLSDNNTIDSFWNSKKFISIRKALSSGEKLSGCKVCWRDGSASMRVRSVNEHINNYEYLQLVKQTLDADGIAAHTPRRLELKPNNLCNLKCMMCNAYDSSQIEKELRELDKEWGGVTTVAGRFKYISPGRPGVWESWEYQLPDMTNLTWAESPEFWAQLEVILPHIDVLSFAGGEPTINPIVHKILSYCVERDYAKRITVYISSNFTNLNKKFYDLMPSFKKFELIASIDGVEHTQEYTRFPSKWEQIEKNFITARAYMHHANVKILVNITVNIMTIYNLVELLKYLDERSMEFPYYSEWPYNINLVSYPHDMRIDWIHPQLRAEIITKIQAYQNSSIVLKQFPELKQKTNLLLRELDKEWNPEEARNALTVLRNSVETLDKYRKINYKEYIPFLERVFELGLHCNT